MTPEAKVIVKRVEKFVRSLRRETLSRMFPTDGAPELWGLNDAESLKDYVPEARKAIRQIRFEIMQLRRKHQGDALKQAIKELFNGLDLRSLLKL